MSLEYHINVTILIVNLFVTLVSLIKVPSGRVPASAAHQVGQPVSRADEARDESDAVRRPVAEEAVVRGL